MNWHELFSTLEVNFILLFSLSLVGWLMYLVKREALIFDMVFCAGCIIATTCAFATLHGYIWRRLAIYIMLLIWSSRLIFYFYRRFLRNNDESSLGAFQRFFAFNLFLKNALIFICQQVVVQIAIWPVLLICSNTEPQFCLVEYIAIALFFLSIAGQAWADQKLCEFRENPQNCLQVYQKGLWRYSRHPNCFFGWTAWCALFLFASCAPFGFTAIISPISMWYAYTWCCKKAESHLFETKGEEYSQYAAKTNCFFPWF